MEKSKKSNEADLMREWEARLAAEGLGATLRQEGTPMGDAIEAGSADEAAERADETSRQEVGDHLYGSF